MARSQKLKEAFTRKRMDNYDKAVSICCKCKIGFTSDHTQSVAEDLAKIGAERLEQLDTLVSTATSDEMRHVFFLSYFAFEEPETPADFLRKNIEEKEEEIRKLKAQIEKGKEYQRVLESMETPVKEAFDPQIHLGKS